jgi:MFS family permease
MLAVAVLGLRDPGRGGTEGGIGWRALGDAWLRSTTWVFTLSAIAVGALVALVPLRLDALGASSSAIGLTFVIASGVAALVSPAAGRWSDRRGRLLPVRVGVVLLAALLLILPIPDSALLVAALAVAVLGISMSVLQTPASALVTDAAERAGMSLAGACMLLNVTFALGETLGAPVGSGLAQATSDALPFALLAAMLLVTLGVLRWPAPQPEAATPLASE